MSDSSKSPLTRKAAAIKKAYAAPILETAVSAIEGAGKRITAEAERFASITLEDHLVIGLHCLKAHDHFAAKDPAKRGQGRKPRNQVTGDVISDQHQRGTVTGDGSSLGSFEGWLNTRLPWLKKPSAYKYMTAVRGLGLDHQASEKQLRTALADVRDRHVIEEMRPPSLASLARAAVARLDDGKPKPTPPVQSEFEFLKDALSHYRQQSETVLNLGEKLKEHPTFHRAACARAYATLAALTGQQWAPSDEPDELATIDPDSISL